MKIIIKRWDTGESILCGEYESIKDCLQKNSGANLYWANLYRANLSEANLYRANLSEANLYGADLYGANLSEANLTEANLYGANLTRADLSGANLSGADLSEANLYGANLSGANLTRADLYEAKLCPPVLLLASWGAVSDDLCLDLMRYDASNHPDPEKFIAWSKGGSCPYSGTRVLRSANFAENPKLIKDDFLARPVKSAYELMQMLIAEKCKVIE